MPAPFIGHGNPMNALASNRYTSVSQADSAGSIPVTRST